MEDPMTNSVLNSARTATADIFGVVSTTATSASKLVSTAAIGIDVLDIKARALHSSVVKDTLATSELDEERIVFTRASEFTDLLEETHRRNFPTKTFDRAKHYEVAEKRIRQALIVPG
jgi:hypothetical protein